MTIFWDVAPSGLIVLYLRFRGNYCLYQHGDESHTLMMEAVSTSETSVNFYKTKGTTYYLHASRRENLKSHNRNALWLTAFQDPNTGFVTNTPLEVFTMTPGKRYRFRLINSFGTVCPAQFSVEGHVLTVIATDGESVQPVNVNTIISFSGQWDSLPQPQIVNTCLRKITTNSKCGKISRIRVSSYSITASVDMIVNLLNTLR
jgi:hypothetical protein